ncbi:MAG: tetratricopeptide repeat protein [Elusimicrobia bacterium]|nr:tetratricopeptide repeat protein [Elusimicrobiota bacterium]
MNKKYILILILIIFGFLLYSDTLKNPFLWDDGFFIKDSNFIKKWENTWVFFSPKNYFKYTQDLTYRPLPFLVNILNYKLWGVNPIGHRLSNIFLHIAVAILLYFLVMCFFAEKDTPLPVLKSKTRGVALLSALFFIAHPANNEVVNMVSFNETQLSTMFFLLSFLCYVKSKNRLPRPNELGLAMTNEVDVIARQRRSNPYSFAVIGYFLAVFSKETAITLPAVIILYDLIIKEKIRIKKYLPFLAVAVFYLILRFFIFRHPMEAMVKYPGNSFTTNILTMLGNIPIYAGLIFLPFNLSMEHRMETVPIFLETQVIAGFLLVIIYLVILVYAYKKSKLTFFWLMWILITFLPTSNIIPMQNIVAERYLYLPLIGFCVLLAMLLLKMSQIVIASVSEVEDPTHGAIQLLSLRGKLERACPPTFQWWGNLMGLLHDKSVRNDKHRMFAMTAYIGIDLAICILAFFSVLLINRNRDWKDEFSFYSKTLKQVPDSPGANVTMGLLYAKNKDFSKAFEYVNKALKLDPKLIEGQEALASIYQDTGEYDKAVKIYEEMAENKKYMLYKAPFLNLGIMYKTKKQYGRAIENFNRAIELNPLTADAYAYLAEIYEGQGDAGKVGEYYKKAENADPDNYVALNALGIIYGQENKFEKSLKYFKRAAKIRPNSAEIHFNIGYLHFLLYEYGEAVKEMETTLKLDPDYKKAKFVISQISGKSRISQ